MKAIHLTTVGMHCSACTAAVEGAVKDIDGVISVTSSEDYSSTSVLFDETQADVDAILMAIAVAGFDATVEQ